MAEPMQQTPTQQDTIHQDAALRDVRARSFGSIAEHYARYRPAPPPDAVDWILPKPCEMALDLGAGTGALTAQVASRSSHVVAAEPDPGMRAVLVRQVTQAGVVGAVAEAIPLRSGCMDAVVASSAWHWMQHEVALVEVARVLHSGGSLGVLWNSVDRSIDWVVAMFGPRRAISEEDRGSPDSRRPLDPDLEPSTHDHHRLELPDSAPFHDLESKVVEWSKSLTVDEIVGLAGTYSRVIVLSEQRKSALLERARRLAVDRLEETGGSAIDVPMRCQCFRAVRD